MPTYKRIISSSFLSRIQTLILISQRSKHTLAGNGGKARLHHDIRLESSPESSCFDIKSWKTVDSRDFGITTSTISNSSWIVLKILQSKGFQAYLVGGCVRDLLLKRIPKDFDVITTAQLNQIKKQFHHCHIVGRRFPICRVHIKGSIIEVSSFDTVSRQAEEKKKIAYSQMPAGSRKKDFILWRNSLSRDFTINSLFYDPFENKIFDYANGMRDLSLCKVRTVVPADCSFKEDCARILRGLRIAARLGLSFNKETAAAIQKLSSSIMTLDKGRLMMEMNYMLSYGAAEASLCLLRRFKLLDILLPFHAAYLAQEAPNQSNQSSLMLMKLFSSMDKLLGCDRPSHYSLWVGLLSFHLALVNNPQNSLVVWAFSSVLYHGNWGEAVNFARKNAQIDDQFVPEILKACDTITDKKLAEDVTHFASLLRYSVDALTELESLNASMARYPISSAGLVFMSKAVAQNVDGLFSALANDITKYNNTRESFEIDYELLGMGDKNEIRFVLGKVIMDAMSSEVIREQKKDAVNERNQPLFDFKKQLKAVTKKDNLPKLKFAQEQNAVDDESHSEPISSVGEIWEVIKKSKVNPKLSNLNEQRDSGKKLESAEPVPNLKQQHQVDKDSGKSSKPRLSSLFM